MLATSTPLFPCVLVVIPTCQPLQDATTSAMQMAKQQGHDENDDGDCGREDEVTTLTATTTMA